VFVAATAVFGEQGGRRGDERIEVSRCGGADADGVVIGHAITLETIIKPGNIEFGAAQLGQQGCVQARPDAGLGPVPKAAPGRHPAGTDRFGRDVAPGDPSPQDLHDPGECRPVGDAQSPGVAAAPLRSGWQERSHALTQAIRHKISTRRIRGAISGADQHGHVVNDAERVASTAGQ
jgi:hypothetical protein